MIGRKSNFSLLSQITKVLSRKYKYNRFLRQNRKEILANHLN